MPATPPEPPRLLDRRKLLWWAFWFVFLTTPIFAILMPLVMPRWRSFSWLWHWRFVAMLAGIAGGAFAAGFLLARLITASTSEFIRRGIDFGLALIVVYGLLGFLAAVLLKSSG